MGDASFQNGLRTANACTWKDGLPILETPRLLLRIAHKDEISKIVGYQRRNREHLRPWEPHRDETYYDEAAWLGAPERDQLEARNRQSFRFRLLVKGGHDDYIGTVSLRNIVFWATYTATIGYSIDHAYEGYGYMREAVSAVVEFGFFELNLRRIEACFMPSNTKSERLLTALRFEKEGLLRSSLEVNGQWEDHVICSRINDDWRRP